MKKFLNGNMRSLIRTVIILMIISANLFSETRMISTNTKLPNNERIWPLHDGAKLNTCVKVKAQFVSSEIVQVVKQGNWNSKTHLIRYRVIAPLSKFANNELSFIVVVRWPTAESGIQMKALPFPFQSGEKEFFLQKDTDVRYMDYYTILSYSR